MLVVVRPDDHAGGTEIAGNCPPGWVAYIGGAIAHSGFTDITFVDALTNHIDDESRRQRLIELDPSMFWQLFDGAPWNKDSFVPPNCRVVVPNFARGCPRSSTARRICGIGPNTIIQLTHVLRDRFGEGSW